MLIADILAEKYSEDNSALHRYLRSDDGFDPYEQWYLVCKWIEDNDLLDEVADLIDEPLASADDMNECDPEIYTKFPSEWKSEIASYVNNWLEQHAPEELPTASYLRPRDKRLLPAQTWLVHFSDEAEAIAQDGFTIGMHDMTKLGLTTRYSNKSMEKSMGGYNFAFIANSRDAGSAAHNRKYGQHAVMFQNSGVRAYHTSDEEEQIMFSGKDVDPQMIILLRNTGDGWAVIGRSATRRGINSLYVSDFEASVQWVMAHYQTYRKKLFSR
jgi:hypothetical protein